jgi:hypothetical protein
VSPSSPLARAVVLVALLGASALAEPIRGSGGRSLPLPTYVNVPRAAQPTTSSVSSRIVFLKRCPLVSGCTVKKGTDDARTYTSSIADGADGSTRIIGEFSQGNEVWDELVACVKTTFAPFDITITDQDPGPDVPHFMNMVGGKPTQLSGAFPNAGGVAPFDCGEIPNAIVYTFDVYGPDPDHLCWTSAQEIAHAFGLEHQFLQKDPLTYLDGDLPKRFRDVDAQCGELEQKACQCARTSQNSYRTIVGLFGPGAPTPPDVLFKRPSEGKEVQPGFKAVIDAQDDVRVEKVELLADGTVVGETTTLIGGGFEIVAPELGRGDHMLEARATDVQGVVGSQLIAVTEGPPCTPDKGCTGSDVCAGGVCVPGPGEEGGLGASCQSDTECLSHRCADAGETLKHCVEGCNMASSDSCPNDFTCLAAGASGGVCWPAPGGCCDAGARPHGPALLGLGVLLVLRRRRRGRARS